MNAKPRYVWIAGCAAAGAVLSVFLPGLDLAFGICIGVVAGIALGSEGATGRCRGWTRRDDKARSQSSGGANAARSSTDGTK